MTDAAYVVAGYVLTVLVVVAYVVWLAARFRRAERTLSTEELERWR